MEDDIIKLQELVAYQQEELSRLSEELYIQQKEIGELRLLCNKLKAQWEQHAASDNQPDMGPERPPPHY